MVTNRLGRHDNSMQLYPEVDRGQIKGINGKPGEI